MLCAALKIVCRLTLFAYLVCWFVFKADLFANNKNQEYMSPSECQKCWVKIRAGRIKIKTDRSWSWSKLLSKVISRLQRYICIRIFCCCWFIWLLLPLWDFVIVLCFVVLYFMSILVMQLCLVCRPGVSWLLSGSSSRCHGFVCSLWLLYFLIILTYYSRK